MLNDTILASLTKTYSDKKYRHTAMLRHKGSLIAFAMDDRRRIHYAVLDQSPDNADSPLDVSLWPGGPTELAFPNEITEVGFGIADQTLLPTYPNGSTQPVKPGARLPDRDKDFFRSTTARLTADAPFQVLTDGRYIYLFRQAIDASHADQVFKQDKDGQPVLDKNGNPVPLVDATLLLDRFVLAGTKLEPRLEVRFQRSRSKTRPASRKDSLGAKDLDGNDFFESTQELKFVGNLTGGRFAVLLLPTAIAGVERWQIFTQNSATGRIDAYNVERSADGLFKTRGSQVFAPTKEGHAESALKLQNANDHVALSKGVTPGETFTFEGWILPEQTQSTQPQVLMSGAKSGTNAGGPAIMVAAQTRIRVDFGGGQGDKFTSKSILTPNIWNHVAVTFDGSAFRFYIGGHLRDKIDLAANDERPPAKPVQFFGAVQNAFKGTLDEIRLWNRARSSRELQADLNQRLTGLEPGLVGYWRFDEATGDKVFDQTNNGADGTLNGGKWVTSDAPIGENAGVNRNTFQIVSRKSDGKLESREVVSGLTALLYFQQSNVPSGYDGQQKPLKQAGRVMLAFATKGTAADDKNYIASLDFGVSASGKIAHAPDRLALDLVNPDPAKSSVNEQLDAVKIAEQQVRVLQDDVKKAGKKRDARKKEYDDLVAQLNGAKAKIHATNASNAAVVLEKGTGTTTYNELNGLGINDRVKSLDIPAPLQVTVFLHDANGGVSITFSDEDTVNLADFEVAGQPAGTKWSDNVSGIVIAANPVFSEKIAKAQQRWNQAKNDLAAQEVLLADAKAALDNLKGVLRSGANAEMPTVHLDASGLSISGGLLGFAWTSDAPLLFDSATGSLALYFRGADDQFFAAYYSTFAEKARYPLVAGNGNQAVVCVARSTDLGMDKIMVEVSDDDSDDTCTLKIAGTEIEETWKKVPREPERFARVLNGQAGHYDNGKLVGYRELVGSGVLANALLTLDAPGLRRTLEKGAALMFGTTRLFVKEAVAQGALEIPVAGIPVSVLEKLPIYFMEYDYAANAVTTRVPGDLFGGSLLLRAVSLVNPAGLPNPDSYIANQRVTSGATLKSKWTAAAPGNTLLFDGTATLARLENTNELKHFDTEDDVTIEAWVRPLKVEERSRIVQHRSANSEYALGLQQKALNTAFKFDGTDDYVTIPKNEALNFSGAVTIEAWIKLEAGDGSRNIAAHGYPHIGTPEMFLRIENGEYQAGIWSNGNHLAATPIPEADKQGKDWVHLAGVYDADAKKWLLYRNGVLEKSVNSTTGALAVEADWGIGANPNPAANVSDRRLWKGEIDDVRIWKRARTQADILADMNRRLAGNETDLVGYWYFENGQARDHSRNFNDGVLHGNPAQAVSPLPAYAVFAGVNGKFVQSKDIIPAGNWAHLAAVFQQNYGLKFNGINTYLNCGNDESLNINTDLTIEAFLRPAHFSFGSGILRRDSDGNNNNKIPYSLDLDISGRLVFSFEDRDGNLRTFTSSAKAPLNQSTRVAVTRKRESQTYKISNNESKTLGWYSIRLHIGNASEDFIYAFDEKTRLAVEEIKKTSPNADIIRAAGDRVPDIGRSNGDTCIGRNKSNFCFNGIISEVRVWNAARAAADIGQEIGGGEEGLVSWWRFEEREGTRANDANGQNHASVNGPLEWVKDPDPQRSGLTLYLNDIGTLTTEKITGITAAENQFALGALANTSPGELFRGELEEVRIWKTPRTREQIEDNLFRRLNGEFDQLIAYYTFDAEADNKLTDNGLRGNHLKAEGSPNYILSTAPIGDDAPLVRSALAGVRTPFSGFVHATPAVQEYADMQMDSRGELIGVFKRCYGFIQNDQLNLLTGYKVGDLAVEWIGQVQFAPQLVGFIEGAPPVPSENLTMPSVEMIGDLDDYNETSTVAFSQAEETTYNYSASKEAGRGLDVELALKFGFKSQTDVGVALAAASLSSIEESKVLVGLRGKFEAMWSWAEEAGFGTTRETGRTTSLELRGRYTTPEENEKEQFGRRFIPDNTGLALVQSETADVFALRLKHNNALISFTMRPNPDIPKDWNIIHFPINPRYIKQGVLDGKVGKMADVDYPNALNYSNDVSYFKPVEAYTFKNNIRRDEKALETYFNQFNAQDKGRKAYFPSESALELTEEAELKKRMRRNLANTYVWTADGGLFAETQQTMEMQTETSGGSYEFRGAGGIDLQIGFAFFKVAAQFELNALYVGQHKLEISKTKESKTAFRLDVSVDKVERDIYEREAGNIKVVKLDPDGKPVKTPYKVDAYRFMSFYLEPDSNHFDLFFNKVVDPIWIEQSDDPAAQALREARQEGKKPPCWRIMHRVTYVSRVLPPLDVAAPPSLEKALQTLDIDSNYELIRQLEPYVSGKLGSFPEFTEAVRETIRQNLPELQPHVQEVIQYMSLYFGIADGQMPDSDQFGETTLSELAPNQPPIVNAGLDQTIGLDGASVSADLEAAVIDDRLEKAEAIFVTWKKIAGEGEVVFENKHEAKTKATFTKRGRYELKLTANDGLLEAEDTLTVIVNERPVVKAGANIETNAFEAQLAGQIPDTGLGDPATGSVTVQWLKSGGLGDVVFEDKNALQTKVTFEKPGNYLLQLSVTNGTFDANAEVTVSVAARVTRHIQALYTFEENNIPLVKDVSGTGAPIDIQIPDLQKVSVKNGSLKIKEPTILTADGTLGRLNEALKTANEITLEAWIKPAAVNSHGLSRILTFSSGPAARNFTLAQNGGSYQLHLRTNSTNDNASNKVLAGATVEPGVLTHLVCTRNKDGQTRIFLNGTEVAGRMVGGNFSNWANNFQLALGNEIGGGTEYAWAGDLHLVAIYSRALTINEIQQNFNFGADLNLPPVVSAGDDAVVNWADFDWSQIAVQKKTIALNGRVTHDRPAAENIRWSQIGGPTNGVVIQNENAAQTTVEVTQKGRYAFRLTAQDGELMSSDETVVVVNVPPNVEIKTGTQKIALTGASVETSLIAELKDSGLGDPENESALTFKWSRTSGPANVQIADATKLQAKANFTARGVYKLKFEAGNGALNINIPVVVTVNQAPVVNAAAPPVITLPNNTMALAGTIVDSGLGNPAEALDVLWTATGPGAVVFADATKLETGATFPTGGIYSLLLAVKNPDNPELAANVEVKAVVNRAPVVDAGPDPAPLSLHPTPAKPYVALRLDGTVSDDGLPDPPGVVTLKWSKVSGPENVTFLPDNEDYTEARFTKTGTYVLQLEANDGHAKTSDQITVVVEGEDTPPELKITIIDTGEPSPPIKRILVCQIPDNPPQNAFTLQWTKVSGPAQVTIEPDPGNKLETTVTFPKAGLYKLKVTVNLNAGGTLVKEVELTVA